MIRNFTYTFISNVISFVISALVTFIVPKILGVENYSYFQLYLFYINYIGFLHFGWADGIFLRYGGEYYNKLNKERFSGQFWLYSVFEIACGIFIGIIGYALASPHEKSIVLFAAGGAVITALPKIVLQYILQATNRIKEYAAVTMVEKIIYVSIVITVMIARIDSFILIVAADLTGKLMALIFAVYQCKDIVMQKPERINLAIIEAKKNISVGIKLMFANIASSLIIGVVRLSIENQWDVVTFGKISLTMSVSNLLMVFIRAVALIMFPMLRRTDESKLSNIYNKMRSCLMLPLLGMLIFYYPIKVVLSAWLPQYAGSLIYMALLFPMCIYESKMSMLIETYMKTLRKENWLLQVNVTTVILSILITYVSVYKLHDLNIAVLSIVILLAFRCVFAEVKLSTVLDISVYKDIVFELVLTIVFMLSSWIIGGINGLFVYTIFYFIYLFYKRKEIIAIMGMIKNKIKR